MASASAAVVSISFHSMIWNGHDLVFALISATNCGASTDPNAKPDFGAVDDQYRRLQSLILAGELGAQFIHGTVTCPGCVDGRFDRDQCC